MPLIPDLPREWSAPRTATTDELVGCNAGKLEVTLETPAAPTDDSVARQAVVEDGPPFLVRAGGVYCIRRAPGAWPTVASIQEYP